MELISREEVREALMRLTMCAREECEICKHKDKCGYDMQCELATQNMNIVLKALESRPKGKWIEVHSPWTEIECSNCKIRYDMEFIMSAKPRHYCPNCGAEMESE